MITGAGRGKPERRTVGGSSGVRGKFHPFTRPEFRFDVGSEQLHVSIAGGPPKVFGTTTGQLHQLRDWLKAGGAKSVAREATGIARSVGRSVDKGVCDS